MQIAVKTANEVKVLAFEGRLDTQTSPDAQTQLNQLIDGATRSVGAESLIGQLQQCYFVARILHHSIQLGLLSSFLWRL